MTSSDTRGASEAMLGANIALSAAIDKAAVTPCGRDHTTMDLLLRIWLSPQSQCRASALSDQLMLSPSHVSRRLDRAAEHGLVCREPDPDDRRAQQVCLTPKGREVVEDFYPRLESVLDQVFGTTLSKPEQATLVDLLNRVETAAREIAK